MAIAGVISLLAVAAVVTSLTWLHLSALASHRSEIRLASKGSPRSLPAAGVATTVERGFYLLAISWVALFGFACVTSIR